MLVTAEEMLKKAKAGKYAVGQFNINNLEWTKAILATAQELQSPVILGVSEGAGKYMTGFGTVAAMVKAMIEEMNITVPVALHLDHGTYEGCYKCIKAGFSSIMFDGSHLPIEENIEKTKELVAVCKGGTIYPDIIESGTKTAKMVKSHHNVGGLPEDLQFELVEPLKQLFKDEVRACGIELGLPAEMVYRQPFPGPGLGVRCLGAITRDRLEAVRESDAILREEFAKAGLDKKVWQYFTVVPDFKSVGMKNHARCFEYMVIIRAINTIDAMTASIEHVDWEILDRITNRILAEVENVNRVCYDMSPKPPATIEFE